MSLIKNFSAIVLLLILGQYSFASALELPFQLPSANRWIGVIGGDVLIENTALYSGRDALEGRKLVLHAQLNDSFSINGQMIPISESCHFDSYINLQGRNRSLRRSNTFEKLDDKISLQGVFLVTGFMEDQTNIDIQCMFVGEKRTVLSEPTENLENLYRESAIASIEAESVLDTTNAATFDYLILDGREVDCIPIVITDVECTFGRVWKETGLYMATKVRKDEYETSQQFDERLEEMIGTAPEVVWSYNKALRYSADDQAFELNPFSVHWGASSSEKELYDYFTIYDDMNTTTYSGGNAFGASRRVFRMEGDAYVVRVPIPPELRKYKQRYGNKFFIPFPNTEARKRDGELVFITEFTVNPLQPERSSYRQRPTINIGQEKEITYYAYDGSISSIYLVDSSTEEILWSMIQTDNESGAPKSQFVGMRGSNFQNCGRGIGNNIGRADIEIATNSADVIISDDNLASCFEVFSLMRRTDQGLLQSVNLPIAVAKLASQPEQYVDYRVRVQLYGAN